MTFDFDSLKIQTFTGINDNPVAPTPNKAGNGSHLIARFNELIDTIQLVLESSSTNASNWIIVTDEYAARSGDKILTYKEDNNGSGYSIYLPETPQFKDSITILHADQLSSTSLMYYHKFQGDNYNNTFINTAFEEVTLIFMGNTLGWIANKQNVITARNDAT